MFTITETKNICTFAELSQRAKENVAQKRIADCFCDDFVDWQQNCISSDLECPYNNIDIHFCLANCQGDFVHVFGTFPADKLYAYTHIKNDMPDDSPDCLKGQTITIADSRWYPDITEEVDSFTDDEELQADIEFRMIESLELMNKLTQEDGYMLLDDYYYNEDMYEDELFYEDGTFYAYAYDVQQSA